MGPFLALSSVIAVITYVLPKTYESEALVLVRPREVPKDFVVDLIADTTEQRLVSIQQAVLSRTNLRQIVTEFGDRLTEFRNVSMDDSVERLRDQINIASGQRVAQGGGGTYFRITYQNRNPELAQEIANKLTTLFIEQDNRVRENQIVGTTEFLSAELKKIEDELKSSEERLRQIKSSRQYELPEQLQTNLHTLDQLIAQKQTNAEALDRYAAIRLNLENQISQTPAGLSTASAAAAAFPGAPPAPPVNPVILEYERAQLAFEQIASRYKPGHPDYDSTRALRDRLKDQVPAGDSNAAAGENTTSNTAARQPSTVPNPVHQTLTTQLREAKTELAIREREKAAIEASIAKYTRRVENTPSAELELSSVNREHTDLQRRYQELKEKLSQARLAESLESKQKGSQFVVVDAANLPEEPTKPNKLFVLFGGCAMSLGFAVALAVAIDIARQRVWTQSEIETLWGVPVLIDIPEILTDSDLNAIRKKKMRFAFSSVGVAAGYAVCLYMLYIEHSFVLQKIDPLLQKLVYR